LKWKRVGMFWTTKNTVVRKWERAEKKKKKPSFLRGAKKWDAEGKSEYLSSQKKKVKGTKKRKLKKLRK